MSTSVSSRAPRPRSRWLRRWVIGISAILLTLGVFILIRTQGHVTGQEFCPTHFRERNFSFYEIPVIHLQITPIKRAYSTSPTAMHVRQNALIKNYTGTPTVWHLVSLSRGLTGTTPADANLLIDQFGIQDGGNPYWKTWSADHVKKAKVFWPFVQKLAERELYILMPELFELAQRDLDPVKLQTEIDVYLQDQYHDLILDMRASERDELADQLLKEALLDYPNDKRLAKLKKPATTTAPSNNGSSEGGSAAAGGAE